MNHKIDRVFERFTKNKQIHEAILFVKSMNGEFSHSNEYGEKDLDTPILLASITKLFTTTCIYILKEQGKLSFDDKLTKYFPAETLSKLHRYKGTEYSAELTISHLLFQTSGLPDGFEEGRNNVKKLIIRQDRQYHFNEIITRTKQRRPHFAPGMGKRAHYASVNFDLLGEIIETVTDIALGDICKQFIFDPLDLKNTYLPDDVEDFIPNIYYKDRALHRPEFVKSCRASGGAISTAHDLMTFIKAFFKRKLFKTDIDKFEISNKLQVSMYPIHYGAGFMKVPLNGLPTLFMGKGELVGHSGSTGSFAFYNPENDLFFVGDVNQVANPALPVQLAMRLAIAVKS